MLSIGNSIQVILIVVTSLLSFYVFTNVCHCKLVCRTKVDMRIV